MKPTFIWACFFTGFTPYHQVWNNLSLASAIKSCLWIHHNLLILTLNSCKFSSCLHIFFYSTSYKLNIFIWIVLIALIIIIWQISIFILSFLLKLHIHYIVDCWQTFQLVLNHFLVFWLVSQDFNQKTLCISNKRCIHFVAFLWTKSRKRNFLPWKIISRQSHFPLKFFYIKWGCWLEILRYLIKNRRTWHHFINFLNFFLILFNFNFDKFQLIFSIIDWILIDNITLFIE